MNYYLIYNFIYDKIINSKILEMGFLNGQN